MELRDVRLALRRYWLLAVLVLALCVALGGAAAFLPTKTYRAKAVVTALIDPNTQIRNPPSLIAPKTRVGNATSLTDYEMENITQRADSRAFRASVGDVLSKSGPDAA